MAFRLNGKFVSKAVYEAAMQTQNEVMANSTIAGAENDALNEALVDSDLDIVDAPLVTETKNNLVDPVVTATAPVVHVEPENEIMVEPVVKAVAPAGADPLAALASAPVLVGKPGPDVIVARAVAAGGLVMASEDAPKAYLALFHTYRGRPSRGSVIDWLTRKGELVRADEVGIMVPKTGQQHPRLLRRTLSQPAAEAMAKVLSENGVSCMVIPAA